jgi:hypothetical protein
MIGDKAKVESIGSGEDWAEVGDGTARCEVSAVDDEAEVVVETKPTWAAED